MPKIIQSGSCPSKPSDGANRSEDPRLAKVGWGFVLGNFVNFFRVSAARTTRSIVDRRRASCIRKTNDVYTNLRRASMIYRPLPVGRAQQISSAQWTEAILPVLRSRRSDGSASPQLKIVGTTSALSGIAFGVLVVPPAAAGSGRWIFGAIFGLLAILAVWIQPGPQRILRMQLPATIGSLVQLGYVAVIVFLAWVFSWLTRSGTRGRLVPATAPR
jgi:hypothetical protein